MYRVFVDTSVWLDIAENPKRFVELAIIEKMVRRGLVQLIVPRLAITEFQRNRANFAHRVATELLPHAKEVRKVAQRIGGPPKQINAFFEYLDHLTSELSLAGGGTDQILNRIERLLAAAPVISQPDAVTKAAVQRGLEKQAPFHGRNGMADALLIETYGYCVRENVDPGVRFVFITSDKGDFSQSGGDKSVPHPDVKQFFSTDKSCFFINVMAALEHINAALVAETLAQEEPTLGVLINHFVKATSPKGAAASQLKKIARSHLCSKKASRLKPNDYLDYIQHRRRSTKPSTVLQEVSLIGSAIKWAQTYLSADVSTEVLDRARQQALRLGFIGKSGAPLVRRLSFADEQRLLSRFREPPIKARRDNIALANVFEFALWSARKQDEICRLEWSDFDETTGRCILRNVSNTGKDLPFRIVGRALEVVTRQKQITGGIGRIFPHKGKSVGTAYRKQKEGLQIPFTFAELRDEGIRRLIESKEYSIEVIVEVAGDAEKVWTMKRELEQAITPTEQADQ